METDIYYYHTDHLGSSSWISNSSGTAQQYLVYLPFGETLLDRRANTTWNTMFSFSGKERDLETGYSYFGARYYDAGTSIWLSVDPMADKYPLLSPYAYCANNPVIYIDPDGRENKPALNWAKNNMSNKGLPFSAWFGSGAPGGWSYKKGTIPTQVVCYDACFIAYMNSSDNVVSLLKETGFSGSEGGFKGRNAAMNWFKAGDGTDRSFVTDISKGEIGDIIFMGNADNMRGHAALLTEAPISGSYTNKKGNTVETMTLKTLSTSSSSDPGNFGEKDYVFEKQNDGSWKQVDGAKHTFRGYGQINAELNE